MSASVRKYEHADSTYGMPIKDRILRLERIKANDLLPSSKNWRTHPQAQAEALRSILADIGFADALLARETPHGLMLIDGHLRTELSADQEVPVLVLDVTEAEADKLLATLDPLVTIPEDICVVVGLTTWRPGATNSFFWATRQAIPRMVLKDGRR